MRFTRRKLLLGLLTILGVEPSSLRGLGERTEGVLADPAQGMLSGLEMEDLVAFAEVLAGVAPFSASQREYLLDHLERRVEQGAGYYLDLYRTTVRLLNRLAGMRFSGLDIPGRVALATRHRLSVSDVRPGESLGSFPEDTRVVRTRAVPDLIGGYYGSPAGWAVVGYGDFPGKCGDLTRYTRAER